MKKRILIVGLASLAITMSFGQRPGNGDLDKIPKRSEARGVVNQEGTASSQTKEQVIVKDHPGGYKLNDEIFIVVEQPAEFPGGQKALMNWLAQNISYPEEAQAEEIEGRVVVKFVVETDGSVSNVEIAKGVHPLLDAEAARVVSLMPNWEPGRNDGMPVRSYFNLPVTFRLTTEIKETEFEASEFYNVEEAKEFEKLGDQALQAGNKKDALAYYKEAFDINPLDLTPFNKAEELLAGDDTGLMDLYKYAIGKFMREDNLQDNLPYVVKVENFYAPTISYLEKLVAMQPENLQNKLLLLSFYNNFGNEAKVIELSENLYKEIGQPWFSDRDRITFLTNYSFALLKEGNYEKIVEVAAPYQELLLNSEKPIDSFLGVYILGKAFKETGKSKESKEAGKWLEEKEPEFAAALFEQYGEL